MNSLKCGMYVVGTIVILFFIGMIIWYVLGSEQKPRMEQEGTLVYRMPEITEFCEIERMAEA